MKNKIEKIITPILLITFNRPEKTRCVLNIIKEVKPEKLFIAADGPRENNKEDFQKCSEVREIVNKIDWPCEVKTLFREKNLGCKIAVTSAIDWFFDNVDEGIILEDDCLPNIFFFNFCQTLLKKYKDNSKIMHISGNNFQDGILRGEKNASYYFSNYTHIWGWATWKRSWSLFNNSITKFDDYKKTNKIKNVNISKKAQKFWIKNFSQTIKNNNNWDSLWMYNVWYNNGISILPQENLVYNIGFGNEATHTKGNNTIQKEREIINTEIVHPSIIEIDNNAENYTFNKIYKQSIIKKIYYKIKKFLLF